MRTLGRLQARDARTCLVIATCVLLTACGNAAAAGDAASDADSGASAPDGAMTDASVDVRGGCDGPCSLADGRVVRGPFGTRVHSFTPGAGAGFGASGLPHVVLGPPAGAGDTMGSTDVVSLGRGGQICLAFDDVTIVDGPGPDFTVFENVFFVAGSRQAWIELGEVSVSLDGREFRTFPCDSDAAPHGGCAGRTPVYSRGDNGIAPSDPTRSGGDSFDLATVGLSRARIVCVRDLETQDLAPPSSGFDLDAIAAIHFE